MSLSKINFTRFAAEALTAILELGSACFVEIGETLGSVLYV
jgi:hypothetical protein